MRYLFSAGITLLLSMGFVAAYTPTNAEWRLHDKMVRSLAQQYAGEEQRTEKSQEMVEKMAAIDQRLEDESLPDNLFWLLSTTKLYLLRIFEDTFPADMENYQTDLSSVESATERGEDDEADQEDRSGSPGSLADDEEENLSDQESADSSSPYDRVQVQQQGIGYTPSPVTVTQGDPIKLFVEGADRLYFIGDVDAWRDNDGGYIIDTSQTGSFQYRCAAGCDQPRKGWILVE